MLICTVNIVFEYIKYCWKSKGRHGIHSPFVYDLIDKGLRIRLDDDFRLKRKSIYTQLASSTSTLERIDLGVGSKRFPSTVAVKSVFKSSSSKGKTADLLFRLARHFQPKRILELGSNLGIGTIHLAAGAPNAELISVEGCPNTAEIARNTCKTMNCANVNIVTSDFSSFLSENTTHFDLIFIDGHHDGNALIAYIAQLKPFLTEESVLILDDIRWSASMHKAWEELKKDPFFHLSIDLFRCGMLAKRSHQQREHFMLRY